MYFGAHIPMTAIEVGDDLCDLSGAEGRRQFSRVVRAAVTGDDVPAIKTRRARVFSNTWNSNAWRIGEGYEEAAESFVGCPVYHEHDSRHGIFGGVVASVVEGEDLVQDLAFNSRFFGLIAEMMGPDDDDPVIVEPRFSISLLDTEKTEYRCSITGENLLDVTRDGQFYWPGLIYEVDGKKVRAEIIMTYPRGAESTITWFPAVPGTGLMNTTLGQALSRRLELARRAFEAGGTAADVESLDVLEQLRQKAADVDVLEQQKAEVEQRLARVQGEQVLRDATQYLVRAMEEGRVRGQLRGGEGEVGLLDLVERVGFDQVKRVLEFTPANPAWAVGRMSDPAPSEPAESPVAGIDGPEWPVQLAAVAERASREKGISYQRAHAELYNELTRLNQKRESRRD